MSKESEVVVVYFIIVVYFIVVVLISLQQNLLKKQINRALHSRTATEYLTCNNDLNSHLVKGLLVKKIRFCFLYIAGTRKHVHFNLLHRGNARLNNTQLPIITTWYYIKITTFFFIIITLLLMLSKNLDKP